MQHLNYCRQALTAFVNGKIGFPVSIDDKKKEAQDIAVYISSMLTNAVKFVLPFNGRTMNDAELRGINRDGSNANLPFKMIALEYPAPHVLTDERGQAYHKRIVVAEDDGENIHIGSICHSKDSDLWCIYTPVTLEKKNLFFSLSPIIFRVQCSKGTGRFIANQGDYNDDIFAVFDLLNALACKNVHIEKSPAKATKQGKKVKAALPFDDYHFLTVDVPGKAGMRGEGLGGSHRSPREHLRRGHIRRLDSGPIWVNACVVNAGIGSKVGKSYLVRKSA